LFLWDIVKGMSATLRHMFKKTRHASIPDGALGAARAL
jgi:hypothetical protein